MKTFDPSQDFAIIERRLPHWSQAGTITFITWRTWDSMPEVVLHEWVHERNAWLLRHKIDPTRPGWEKRVHELPPDLVHEFTLLLSERWNAHLDDCHGECVLRKPVLSKIVADSLRHFDGQRYDLTDFVVMPNHVHLLVAFPTQEALLAQCESWKHFTAANINREFGRRGRFWQQDGFDHLVRSQKQFEYFRQYIADNPRRAHLTPGEYVHESKLL